MPLVLASSVNTSTLHIAQVAKFCTIAPNICASSVWNLLCYPSGTYYFEMAPRCFENLYTHIHGVVAQWLRCCATNLKVAGSIPAGVSGIFIDIKSFRSHYGPGVDSASNRNEYQKYFLGVKAASA